MLFIGKFIYRQVFLASPCLITKLYCSWVSSAKLWHSCQRPKDSILESSHDFSVGNTPERSLETQALHWKLKRTCALPWHLWGVPRKSSKWPWCLSQWRACLSPLSSFQLQQSQRGSSFPRQGPHLQGSSCPSPWTFAKQGKQGAFAMKACGQGSIAATGTPTTKPDQKANTPGQSGVPGVEHGRSAKLELGKTQSCGCGSEAGGLFWKKNTLEKILLFKYRTPKYENISFGNQHGFWLNHVKSSKCV